LLILAVLLITFLSFIVFRFYRNKELNKRLKELNATKDKFFSIVAHDLKNPFNNLLGYSELLAADYENMEEDERKQVVRGLHNSSKKLLALLENLLQWSSANIGSLKYSPQTISIKEQIDELIDLYSDSIKQKNLGIELNADSALTAFIDVDYLKLVMRNLISNAIKFSHPGGNISIKTDVEGVNILLKVKDNGIGMDEQQLEGLFELGSKKSTRGTQNETGTGLGLILAKDLITGWGGKIFVESELNKGCTFTITIPKN
jgi:signal transduction histidine kinase